MVMKQQPVEYAIMDVSVLTTRKQDQHKILCLLLPVLEFHLRRLFVCLNHLDESAFMANSRQYYATIDMFVREEIEDQLTGFQTGIRNLVVPEIGLGLTDVLWDLFILQSGPRPRYASPIHPHSHSEIDWHMEKRFPLTFPLFWLIVFWVSLSPYVSNFPSSMQAAIMTCNSKPASNSTPPTLPVFILMPFFNVLWRIHKAVCKK